MFGEGFDPGNGLVSNRKECPLVTGNACTGCQGKEKIVPVGVAGGGQSDGTERARLGSIGRVVVFEELYVGTEF